MDVRVIVCSRQGSPLFEIPPDDVFGLTYTEELGGEHSLDITTTRALGKGMRILTKDATGKWREHVVEGVDEAHQDMRSAIGTYTAVWSLQSDMTGVICDTMPGVGVTGGVSAQAALESLLTHTSRWGVGTVTCANSAKASFYGMSAWEALGVLSKTWECEIDAEIAVGADGVTTRSVALLSHTGSASAVRRFDYSYDLTAIRRKVSSAPVWARIIPLGKGEELEGGGYGRRITIESVNDGVKWLQNDDVASAYRLPDGSGGWEYPTRNVVFENETTPASLKAAAQAAIEEYTVPKVTYSADVVQLAAAGMDAHGIALGDEVHCVDRGFGPDGVRVSGRVVRLVTNGLDPTDVKVTIGNVAEGVSDYFQRVSDSFKATQDQINHIDSTAMTSAEYLTNIISNLNSEINATGGYWYITEGQGVRTYDHAVSDPLVGAEATAVTEMRGGTLRFANSRTAQGEWDWKTVIVSGHIAANLVTAANINTGFIGSPSGNYWNLDTGELKMSGSVKVGSKTLEQYIADHTATPVLTQEAVFNALTNNGSLQGLFMSGGNLYVNASYLRTGIIADAAGKNYWNMATGEFSLSPTTATGDTTIAGIIAAANTAEDAAESAMAAAKEDVGATNLLIDTSAPSLTKVAATANRYWSHKKAEGVTESIVALTASARPVGGVSHAAQFVFSANQKNKNWSGICFYKNKAVQLINKQKYTLSCWAKTTTGSGEIWLQYGQTSFVASKKITISSTWKRYSFTFEFLQTKAGGTNGARVYFYGRPRTDTACTIRMCGFKLETGGKATDWSAAPEDTGHDVADAVSKAKTFTNTVSAADRLYTRQQREALDTSLNQQKIFKRLTNNGAAQAIILKNGQIYINASYISAGTVDAGIIKAGILTDSKGKNVWNMASGYFTTSQGELRNCSVNGALTSGIVNTANPKVILSDGNLKFTNWNEQTFKIRANTNIGRGTDKKFGVVLDAKYATTLSTPKLWIEDGDVHYVGGYGGGKYTNQGVSALVDIYYPTFKKSGTKKYWDGTIPAWRQLTLQFVNGLCIYCRDVAAPQPSNM